MEVIKETMPWSSVLGEDAPLPPALVSVSTDEIDGEDDPLERAGRGGGDCACACACDCDCEAGTAETITPLCFLRGRISLIWMGGGQTQSADAMGCDSQEQTANETSGS